MKKIISILALSLGLIGGVENINAQYRTSQKSIYDAKAMNITSLRSISAEAINNSIVLDELDSTKLQEYNNDRDGKNRLRTLKYAVVRDVEINPMKHGNIYKTKEGRYFWLVNLISPKAKSISLHFDKFELQEGAALFIRNENEEKGAYTYLNNRLDKQLSLAPISGDSISIVYDFPIGVVPIRENIPISIDKIYHDFVGFYSLMRNASRFGTGEPLFDYRLDTYSCAPEVNSINNIFKEAQGVVLITIPSGEMGTASLINNTKKDGKAYLLTASHVINKNFEIENDMNEVRKMVEQSIAFFNYSAPVPGEQIVPSLEQSLTNLKLVAYNPEVDMALLEIENLPQNENGIARIPKSYMPYFNGWNIEDDPAQPFFGIHHPWASTKRYNLVDPNKKVEIRDYSVGVANFTTKYFNNKHWWIDTWAIGTTAAGSSGSPLLDNNGLIVGALTGGASYCHSPHSDAYYAIKTCWENDGDKFDGISGLKAFLDSDNSGLKTLQGYSYPEFEKTYRLSSIFKRKKTKDLTTAQISTNIKRIGNVYELEKGDKILGAYLSIYGNQELQDNFPKIDIKLNKINNNNLIDDSNTWSTSLSKLGYSTYIPDKKNINILNRSIDNYKIEVFIDASTPIEIDEKGRYILNLSSDIELNKLNIVALNTERQSENIMKNNSFAIVENKINTDLFKNQTIFLDLLVESKELRLNNVDEIKNGFTNDNIVSFFHKDYIFINAKNETQNKNEVGKLELFDMSGIKVYETYFQEGEQIKHLPTSLSSANYIVKLSYLNKNMVYKISYRVSEN